MTREADTKLMEVRPPLLSGHNLAELWMNAGMLLVTVAIFTAASIFVESFFSWNNLVLSLGLAVTTVGMIACTMLFCLAAGDFDLSVGSIVAMSGVLAAVVTNFSGRTIEPQIFGWHLGTLSCPDRPGLFLVLGIASGILAGGLVGLVNGFVIARLGINALITTLATMQIVRGLGFVVSGGSAVGVANEGFYILGSATLPIPLPGWLLHRFVGEVKCEIPVPLLIMLGCVVLFGLLLHKTTFGRNTLAIGGNKEAAHLAGIAVTRTKILIFTLQGLMAGFAGVMAASQQTSGQPNDAKGLELAVISACVLGGVSLSGGIGSILCVIVGVLIMGMVQNIMSLQNVDTFYQYIASGAILLAAVIFDRFKNRQRS